MEAKEIREKAYKLNSDIAVLLSDFSNETGFAVEDLNINTIYNESDFKYIVKSKVVLK